LGPARARTGTERVVRLSGAFSRTILHLDNSDWPPERVEMHARLTDPERPTLTAEGPAKGAGQSRRLTDAG